ncbi:MAG: Arginase, partial [Acidobacteriota bacterium]
MRPVHLIGVPLDLGGNRRGTDMGPSAFRIAGIGEQLSRLGIAVVDKGDVPSPIPEAKGAGDAKKRYVKDIAKVCQRVYQTSLASFSEGAMPIALGGDHSLAAGSVAAAAMHARKQNKPLGVIWVDAHADMNNPSSTESGNVHGMPLAALLGTGPSELSHFGGSGAAISAKHTVLVGIRNLDEVEKQIVRASKVHA